jgi:ribonuclease D
MEPKRNFREKKEIGQRISGKARIRPQNNHRYSNFNRALRLRNEWTEYPFPQHPKKAIAETWYMTNEMKARPAFPPTPPTEPRRTSINIVESQEDFEEMMIHLKTQHLIAIDLENSLEPGYWGINHAALLQISSETRDYIICPYMCHDEIETLRDFMLDPKIMKLMFDATNDLKCMATQWQMLIVGLMDMQKAFMEFFPKICENKQPGFQKVMNFYFPHVKINKDTQCCDWKVRPLTFGMRSYARDDTHILIRAWKQMTYHHMKKEFDGNWIRIAKICNNMTTKPVFIEPYPTAKSTIQKLGYNIPIRTQVLFQKLYDWRQNTAKTEDVRPWKIMTDKNIYDCCVLLPTALYENTNEGEEVVGLQSVPCMYLHPVIIKQSQHILQIIKSHSQFHLKRKSTEPEIPTQNKPKVGVVSETGMQAPAFLSETHQNSKSTFEKSFEEINVMLDELGAIYDSTHTIEAPKTKEKIQNKDTDESEIELELQETLDSESEIGESKLMCFTCYIPGHTKKSCQYQDLSVRNLPDNRAVINVNKLKFYSDRPEIKSKRNSNRHRQYRKNKTFRMSKKELTRELDLLLDPA